MTLLIEEISRRIAAVESDDCLKRSNLLFHGTCEPFEGDLEPSSHDRVLWFAEAPIFAQAYIPAYGASAIVTKPDDWTLQNRVRPDKNSFWTEFASTFMKAEMPIVDYDHSGMAKSWSIPHGWPTYGECLRTLEAMGYDFSSGHARIKISKWEGISRHYVEAAWMKPGRVYVTTSDNLNLLDLSISEGNLSDPMHKRIDLFREAEMRGYDGIIINDFAQSEDCGNVDHRAVGLFAGACPRACLVYPAVHRRLSDPGLITEDFRAFRETLSERMLMGVR